MKVLLIEDNTRLAERVRHHLRKTFVIDTATTAEEGLAKARAIQYRAILLDLNLPDMNGREVCTKLRASGNTTPILVVSGAQDAERRIDLLDCGADDFIVKPFNPQELIARIRSVMRRHQWEYNQHILKVQDLTIDVNRRKVTRAGEPIKLRKKEFDILEYLVANRGQAVTRPMILTHVWDSDQEIWQKTVDVHIKYLRDKIDKPFKSRLIKTAYGVGYMIDDAT